MKTRLFFALALCLSLTGISNAAEWQTFELRWSDSNRMDGSPLSTEAALVRIEIFNGIYSWEKYMGGYSDDGKVSVTLDLGSLPNWPAGGFWYVRYTWLPAPHDQGYMSYGQTSWIGGFNGGGQSGAAGILLPSYTGWWY